MPNERQPAEHIPPTTPLHAAVTDVHTARASSERPGWLNVLRSPTFDDPHTTRAAGVLAPLLTILSVVLIAIGLTGLGVASVRGWQVVAVVVTGAVIGGTRWLVQVGRVNTAAWITTVLLFVMATSALLNDATPAGYPAAFALAVAIAGFTLRRPGPIWSGGLAAALIVGVSALQHAGALQLRRPPEVGAIVAMQSLSMLMLSAIVLWANRALDRARERAVTQEQTANRLAHSLARARRLEAIGRLAGGVAHDFNNLLTVITANAFLLYDEQDLSASDRESCEAIIKAAETGASLTQQLLAFGGRQVVRPLRLDLAEVVNDFRPLLEHMASGAEAELQFQTRAGDGCTKADPGRIQQAVANLVINAGHASEAGDVIEVVTERVKVSEARAIPHGTIPPGTFQVLRVRDYGTGMDADTMAAALEPFFTSRAQGEGTGLGLAVVHGVVKQSGGHVELESAVGQGTTVSLWFPSVSGAPEWRPRGAPNPMNEALARMNILLVDDDNGARDAVRKLLENAGASVAPASSGAEALATADAAGAIDLAIIDVIMPGMSGPILAEQLRARGFGGPIVFLTGYAEPAELRGAFARTIPVLYKPVSSAELVQMIEAQYVAAANGG